VDRQLTVNRFQPFFYACQSEPSSTGGREVEATAAIIDLQLDLI